MFRIKYQTPKKKAESTYVVFPPVPILGSEAKAQQLKNSAKEQRRKKENEASGFSSNENNREAYRHLRHSSFLQNASKMRLVVEFVRLPLSRSSSLKLFQARSSSQNDAEEESVAAKLIEYSFLEFVFALGQSYHAIRGEIREEAVKKVSECILWFMNQTTICGTPTL